MFKKIYLYKLTDAKGNVTVTVVNDLSDDGCIGGYDSNGNYQQYDSYELYHAYTWAEEHGMKFESGSMNIEVPNEVFNRE
jgi:hypothetical protein